MLIPLDYKFLRELPLFSGWFPSAAERAANEYFVCSTYKLKVAQDSTTKES